MSRRLVELLRMPVSLAGIFDISAFHTGNDIYMSRLLAVCCDIVSWAIVSLNSSKSSSWLNMFLIKLLLLNPQALQGKHYADLNPTMAL